MKYIELTAFGTPWEVCRTVDGADVAAPGPGEVAVRIHAGPINPAELLLIEGKYAAKPALPARLGIEGVGTVSAVGDGVTGLRDGDRVMSLGRTNWAEEIIVSAASLIHVPAGIDMQQLSMLKVNPATALLMLERYVTLEAGDWVIQNAANSAVGRYLIQLARARGLHTVNVVRRANLVEELRGIGADLVLVGGDDLPARVRAEVGDVRMPLAIDAVAGRATQNLAGCLSEGGTVVNYGLLSGEACQLSPDQLVFSSISLTGFWLAKLLGAMPRAEMQTMYSGLAAQMASGVLHAPVEAAYGLDQIGAALKHASQSGRSGKILMTPAIG